MTRKNDIDNIRMVRNTGKRVQAVPVVREPGNVYISDSPILEGVEENESDKS